MGREGYTPRFAASFFFIKKKTQFRYSLLQLRFASPSHPTPLPFPSFSPCRYAAPEILFGDLGSARSDVWSLGVIVAEAMTLTVPITIADRVDGAPFPPAVLSSLGGWVQETTIAACGHDPLARPSSLVLEDALKVPIYCVLVLHLHLHADHRCPG